MGPAGSRIAGRPLEARLLKAMRAGIGRFAVPIGDQAASAATEPNRTFTGSPALSRASMTLISTSSSSLTAEARAALASSPWLGGTGSSTVPLMRVR
jgi:hypothetical protein